MINIDGVPDNETEDEYLFEEDFADEPYTEDGFEAEDAEDAEEYDDEYDDSDDYEY